MFTIRIARCVQLLLTCVCMASISTSASAAFVTFSVGGSSSTASVAPTIDSFRAALGDPNNGNAPGPLAGGRREINWDGGGAATNTTPPVTPFNVFQNTRGGQFTTPGTGLTQATPTGLDRKSTRLNSSHSQISYAVF